jgi:dTDP-4-amino-4,6-dideoxygalactose transaminase
MNIPLLDLVAQYHSIKPEIDAAVLGVLESGKFILGPNVTTLEEEVSAYLGVKYGIGVASGTDALIIALRAVGVEPGDEVIVPAYSFFATAGAVLSVDAVPVFVDIDPLTYCIDVSQIEAKITAKTKAIIPVHLYGQSADMDPILEIARAHHLKVVEDNAQAFGAEYKGKKTGSMGDAGCLSFFPSKNLGAYGDAGMVVTNDLQVAENVRVLRTHGWKKKYFPKVLGYNSRLDEMQAAVLRVKLKYVDGWNARRRELAHEYTRLLFEIGLHGPAEAPGRTHVYHLYIVRVQDRAWVQKALKEKGIASVIYYPQPLHWSEPCKTLSSAAVSLPVSEAASGHTLALPLDTGLTPSQLEAIAAALAAAGGLH